jgi:hypothetical protein
MTNSNNNNVGNSPRNSDSGDSDRSNRDDRETAIQKIIEDAKKAKITKENCFNYRMKDPKTM